MGGRSSRTKGHAFEREIAQRLRPYDKECRRNVSESQVASIDIITRLPFGIQCKRLCEWINPSKIYLQAVNGTKLNGVIPMGVVRIDREDRIVCLMSLVHFRIFFEDMIKKHLLVFKRREKTILRKKKKFDFKPKKPQTKFKVSPYTLITDCFENCLPDQHPVGLWRVLYKLERNKTSKGILACFDFELFLAQIEKVYGKEKEENSSYKLQL